MMSHDPVSPESVGHFLAGEVEARGWTLSEFADVLGRPVQFVSEIVNGKKEITRESAAQIGAALGQSPAFWLNMQNQDHLSIISGDAEVQQKLSEVRRRAKLASLLPLAVLQKRGVLPSGPLEALEAEVIELLELASLDDRPAFKIAARRSNATEALSPVQAAWVACVRSEARRRKASAVFSLERFRQLASDLPVRLALPESFTDVPRWFADCGVTLVYIESLPTGKMDGCAFMLDGAPVVALSGRGKRLDKILWTLLHEAAHVVLRHITANIILDSFDEGDERGLHEDEADAMASRWLLPTPLPHPPARVGAGWVNTIARQRGLAPIVIVGQLQKGGQLDWRTTLARNAPSVSKQLESW